MSSTDPNEDSLHIWYLNTPTIDKNGKTGAAAKTMYVPSTMSKNQMDNNGLIMEGGEKNQNSESHLHDAEILEYFHLGGQSAMPELEKPKKRQRNNEHKKDNVLSHLKPTTDYMDENDNAEDSLHELLHVKKRNREDGPLI
jgi:hypothetical protein